MPLARDPVLAGIPQLFRTILPDRLQQAIARLPALFLHRHERLVYQLAQQTQDCVWRLESGIRGWNGAFSHLRPTRPDRRAEGTDSFCRLQCESTGEDRQPAEQPSFRLREEIIAP